MEAVSIDFFHSPTEKKTPPQFFPTEKTVAPKQCYNVIMVDVGLSCRNDISMEVARAKILLVLLVSNISSLSLYI